MAADCLQVCCLDCKNDTPKSESVIKCTSHDRHESIGRYDHALNPHWARMSSHGKRNQSNAVASQTLKVVGPESMALCLRTTIQKGTDAKKAMLVASKLKAASNLVRQSQKSKPHLVVDGVDTICVEGSLAAVGVLVSLAAVGMVFNLVARVASRVAAGVAGCVLVLASCRDIGVRVGVAGPSLGILRAAGW